jgi:hypothetical protein
MPWYSAFSKALEPYSEMVLIGIIVVTILILLYGEKYGKLGWAVYLVSP